MLGTHGEERKRVIALFIVVFFVIFFWAAYEQTGSSMNLFADKNTNLHAGSFTIPSSWFQSVNPVGHRHLRADLRVDVDVDSAARDASRRPRSRWCWASRCSRRDFCSW